MNPLSTDEQSHFARAFRFAAGVRLGRSTAPHKRVLGCGEGPTGVTSAM